MNKVVEIYKKEREYQQRCFGDYKNLPLNLGSFLIFIEEYLQRAKKAYSGLWQKELPDWLVGCEEMQDGSAPVKVYEELIKVMALAGAALETYSVLDPNQWRTSPEEGRKWRE